MVARLFSVTTSVFGVSSEWRLVKDLSLPRITQMGADNPATAGLSSAPICVIRGFSLQTALSSCHPGQAAKHDKMSENVA